MMMCRAPSSAAAASATSSPRNSAAAASGHQRRIGQQPVGQRLQAGFAGDLRLRPALGLVRQIDVLDAGLGVRRQQRRAQVVGELALLLDGGDHRGAAGVELAEVAETLLQRAELPVVEAAGDLLAVAGDERHRRALVEQSDGRGHLGFADGQFVSKAGIYGLDGRARSHAETLPNAPDATRWATPVWSNQQAMTRELPRQVFVRGALGAVATAVLGACGATSAAPAPAPDDTGRAGPLGTGLARAGRRGRRSGRPPWRRWLPGRQERLQHPLRRVDAGRRRRRSPRSRTFAPRCGSPRPAASRSPPEAAGTPTWARRRRTARWWSTFAACPAGSPTTTAPDGRRCRPRRTSARFRTRSTPLAGPSPPVAVRRSGSPD